MSDLLYDKWREFYLQQLAAGEISTETRQYDLEQMWLSTQLNSKVIRVTEGQSVQAAIDAAVEAGAGRENPWIVEVGPGVYEISNHLVVKSGVSLLGSGKYATVIKRSLTEVAPGTYFGAVLQDNVSLQELTIECNVTGTNTSSGAVGVAPTTSANNTSIGHCRLVAQHWGYNVSGIGHRVEYCEIEASNPLFPYGTNGIFAYNHLTATSASAQCFGHIDGCAFADGLFLANYGELIANEFVAGMQPYLLRIGGHGLVFDGNDITTRCTFDPTSESVNWPIRMIGLYPLIVDDRSKSIEFRNNRFCLSGVTFEGCTDDIVCVGTYSVDILDTSLPEKIIFDNNEFVLDFDVDDKTIYSIKLHTALPPTVEQTTLDISPTGLKRIGNYPISCTPETIIIARDGLASLYAQGTVAGRIPVHSVTNCGLALTPELSGYLILATSADTIELPQPDEDMVGCHYYIAQSSDYTLTVQELIASSILVNGQSSISQIEFSTVNEKVGATIFAVCISPTQWLVSNVSDCTLSVLF